MLGSLRKFSTTVLAKILFGIVVVPLIFWGMGTSFTGGNKNIVLMIEKEKYSIQKFTDFVRKFAPITQKVTSKQIEEIAKQKLEDLNAVDIKGAINMVKGSAVSMGMEIID